MKVFVTGASGWIGSALLPVLLGADHSVLGLARSDASAAAVEAAGAEALRGSIDELDVLRRGAAESDAVVHLAFNHDFSQFEASIAADARVIAALGDELAGSNKPFAVASGTPVVPGGVATESDTAAPAGPAGARVRTAQAVVDLAAQGVRSSVVRLPRSVHGTGDHGFIAQLIGVAREKGISGYVGDGTNRWPAVHVTDAAQLFLLALENAPAGSVLHAVGDEGIATRDIAEAIGHQLQVPAVPVPAEDLGFLGMLMSQDQPASATATEQLLGWQPTGPGLLADIDQGHYVS